MGNNLTGYPSVDKPQMAFYRTDPIRHINTESTVYELIFDTNRDHMADNALEYMGVIWSYEKLKKETDRAASAFARAGLRMGDVVLIAVSNSPEAVVTLLAPKDLGVVSKWIDIRASAKDIEQSIKESNCRMMVAFDNWFLRKRKTYWRLVVGSSV